MKIRLFIISAAQFGYLKDYYKYCQYLSKYFQITYYCWDYNQPRIILDEIEIHYISRKGNVVIRNIRFLYNLYRVSSVKKFDLFFIEYFMGCSIASFYAKSTPRILDLRTSSIRPSKFVRFINNSIILIESYFFKKITIITRGLAKLLHISLDKIIELPLGADAIIVSPKIYQEVHLLYVGTLYTRRIEDTIIGYSKFLEYNKKLITSYTIVGKGLTKEEERLKELTEKLNLKAYVDLTGYIKFESLGPYFEKATIGISYIPITKYYDVQPPTKTFEYLQAGLPVLATNTIENSKIINQFNGILIDDNPDSFAEGLRKIVDSFHNYDMKIIQSYAINNTWFDLSEKLKKIIYKELKIKES